MAAPTPTLDEIRAEIDRIDQAIHDLLMQRVEVVRKVARVKGASAPKWRPAREAVLVRRLAARHKGEMPIPVLVRIWREMIVGGSLALQEAVSIAVVDECWALARDHFGSSVPFMRRSATQVVRDVVGGKATIGVLPAAAKETWWKALAGKGADAPRIVTKLPFAGRAKGEAFAIARAPFEPSGSDHSLLVVEASPSSRGSSLAAVRKAGFAARTASKAAAAELVDVEGFVGDDDPRLAVLRGNPRLRRVTLIGGYAVPLAKS